MSDLQQPRKDPKLIASAVLVGLIVVAGIVLVGIRAFGGDDDPTPTSPSESTTTSSSGASSVCGLPDGDQTIPTDAPPTKWYFKGKVAAPASSTFGPAKGGGGDQIASCFARNPVGALFAGTSLAADIYPRDEHTKQALKLRSVPGQALTDALKEDLGAPGPISQIVGFRFEDYTRDRATITLAARLTDGPNAGALGATPMTLAWRDGDWYLQLQSTGDSIVLTSLDGFVRWSAVS